MLTNLKQELAKLKNPAKAKILQRFFKTGPGEYGEGDKFLGITVPEQRKIALKYKDLKLSDIDKLLKIKIHEYRLVAIFILVHQFQKNKEKQLSIYRFYLNHTKHINNWDLVDLSAYKIVGEYLLEKNRNILYKLAKSKSLWERRISIISTFQFIRQHQFEDTLKISEILLNDHHDLIHKAVGWMLREVGKKDQIILEEFLQKFYTQMPRTMLRYAIEGLPDNKRKFYLAKK